MSFIVHARLRRDTPAGRQLVAQLLAGARQDGGHRLVWNLFAANPDAPRDFLYREVEPGAFLAVSARAPTPEPAIWDARVQPYAPALATGQRLRFILRANPTVSRSRSERAPSRRIDVVDEARRRAGGRLPRDQMQAVALDWLAARGERLGVAFDTEACVADRREVHAFARPKTAPATLASVDFSGRLEVRDPALLSKALVQGVGRGKAFGMGLLLLRPLGD